MKKYTQEKVSKYMTKEVITLTEDSPIEEAIKIFIKHGFRGIPVIEDKKLKGIALEKDLLELFFIPEHSLKDMRRVMKINCMLDPQGKVKYFMRRAPLVVHPEYTMGYLIRLMLRHDILTVPVVEKINNELVGIITITDLQELIDKACLSRGRFESKKELGTKIKSENEGGSEKEGKGNENKDKQNYNQ